MSNFLLSLHAYEVRPRKDKRGVDLISDALPFGGLWYGEPDAISNAIGYAKFYSRSHPVVIRVFDQSGTVIETHEQANGIQRVVTRRIAASNSTNAVSFSSARTTKRFLSPRCASAIQIVRPRESAAEVQPQLQPRFFRLSAMISQYFRRWEFLPFLSSTGLRENEIMRGNDGNK